MQRYRELSPTLSEVQQMEFSPGPNQRSSTQVDQLIEAETNDQKFAEKRSFAKNDHLMFHLFFGIKFRRVKADSYHANEQIKSTSKKFSAAWLINEILHLYELNCRRAIFKGG